jgi:uncharacterized protein
LKEILLRANAAISRGDIEGFLEHCTEDTVWTFVGEQTLQGKAAVRQWMRENYKEPPQFRLSHTIEEGDSLAALGEITLKDEEGHATRHAYCDVWRFRDDLLAEVRAFVVPLE